MTVRDWRDVRADALLDLYSREQQHWLSVLDWDAATTWHTIEQARTTWGLPGLVVEDDAGRISGWTFYLPQDGAFEVGGITADTPAATQALVDALEEAARAANVRRLSLFVCDRAPGLAGILAAHGFDVQPYLYLRRALDAADAAHAADAGSAGERGWVADDLAAAAALLQASYGNAGVHFAPDNQPDEWLRYAQGLTEQAACGVLMPEATRVRDAEGELAGLVVTTRIAGQTAHIAQVAVAPGQRRRGMAAALVAGACARAAGAGCRAITLLVAAGNTPALGLYRGLGFGERTAFVAARRVYQPRRLTSVALASGGATTLR